MRIWLLILALVLGGCGGGGSRDAPPATSEAAPLMRFVASHDEAAKRLTIAPLAGAMALGSRAIAKVEVSIGHRTPQVLTAPNGTNAAGQPTYVFATDFPPPPTSVLIRNGCSTNESFRITVTDVAGFAFTKWGGSCRTETFGAFSDYGDRDVAFRFSGPAGSEAVYWRYGAQGAYLDLDDLPLAGGVAPAVFRSFEGDNASAQVGTAGSADGTVVTLDIDGAGGANAHSELMRKASVSATFVDAFLACCRPAVTAATSTASRTVTFAIAPGKLGPIVGAIPAMPFAVHYRVFNPVAQRVVTEFTGSGAGYTTYAVQAKPGDQLSVEASPMEDDSYLQAFVALLAAAGDSPSTVNALGQASAFLPGRTAKINVYCCSR